MAITRWKIAQTGTTGLATDPRIILRNYLRDEWATGFASVSPTATYITFDTKLTSAAKQNTIIVEMLPAHKSTGEHTIGNGRKSELYKFRIFVTSKGFGCIDKAWKMVERIDEMIDGNKLNLTSSGVDEMWVDDYDVLVDNTEEVMQKGQATSNQLITYVIRATLKIDKYQTS